MAKPMKCKICGDTEFTEVGELLQCRSCKHKTPKPKDNAELLERANNLRFETKSFDDAAELYEEIIRLTPDEAEAYWGRALCRYGIEYVKDSDGKYLPTCHRTIEDSILDDADYKMAVMKAQRGMAEYYMTEAQTIDEYQKKIKLIASKEEPYDVFISFKATDEHGRPTEDSLLAQEIYYYLTKNLGLKVFFSNITLKDKAGQEYEPIIYAALSSATVMVLVGTRPEYVNATWVKNEWSRYIRMIAAARQKNKSKYIVTALKTMRPEELPSALAAYQAVDLAQLGAKEKLCSNIDSLIGDLRVSTEKKTGGSFDADDMLAAEAANLCHLGFQQLELGSLAKAGEYFQKALEKKADAALALWGKLLISEDVASDGELAAKAIPIKEYALYKLAVESATAEEKMRFETTAKKCQDAFDRADSKTRHTNEYRTKVEELKYHHTKNVNYERIAFDEKADALYDEYFDTKNKCTNIARAEHDLRMKSSGIVSTVIAIIVSVLLLVASLQCGVLINTVNDKYEELTGVRVIDALRESGVTFSELIASGGDITAGLTDEQIAAVKGELPQGEDAEKSTTTTTESTAKTKATTTKRGNLDDVSPEPHDLEADAEVTDVDTPSAEDLVGEAVLKELLIVFGIVFVLCAAALIAFLKLFLSTKAAIVITIFVGGTAGAFVTVGLMLLEVLKPALPAKVSIALLALFVLLLVLFIVRKIKRNTKAASLAASVRRMTERMTELQTHIAEYSCEQMAALNHHFYDRYGDEIDEYEAENVIVQDVLSAKWSL